MKFLGVLMFFGGYMLVYSSVANGGKFATDPWASLWADAYTTGAGAGTPAGAPAAATPAAPASAGTVAPGSSTPAIVTPPPKTTPRSAFQSIRNRIAVLGPKSSPLISGKVGPYAPNSPFAFTP